uniref:Uncharacterized protein n=1 Tax=Taeniopygia guttata TaxID=59729 RepID=A0A674GAH2_TAEGU
MMAEALDRWLREEMEVPPSAVPSPAALRRLCSSPTAPVWDFVIRHVRNQRNVKKIRGNLRWSRHLQEVEAAASPPSRQRALLAARARLRQELRDVTAATAHAQETARRLELSLGAGQSRRWAELRRGAELRLLGAEPRPEGLRGGLRGALQATPTSQSRAELSAILALGAEPEVLVSIKALCTAREAELQQRPRPPRAANHPREAPDWLKQAEAVLIGHSPGAVLWALEALANQSTRALLSGPAPSAEAPPTLRRLLQVREFWGEIWEFWGKFGNFGGNLGILGEIREFWGKFGNFGGNSGILGEIWEFWGKFGNFGGNLGILGGIWEFWGKFGKFGGNLGILGGNLGILGGNSGILGGNSGILGLLGEFGNFGGKFGNFGGKFGNFRGKFGNFGGKFWDFWGRFWDFWGEFGGKFWGKFGAFEGFWRYLVIFRGFF